MNEDWDCRNGLIVKTVEWQPREVDSALPQSLYVIVGK